MAASSWLSQKNQLRKTYGDIVINIVLCGGSGTRLWPLSRTLMPKQFIRLFDGQSLFQDTLRRNGKICSSSVVVVNNEQYLLALDQASQVSSAPASYLLEPVGRNTAPAIALACLALDEDEVVLVTPSDHLVKRFDSYKDAANEARRYASEGYLVTFGIQPAHPETGFGYIEAQGNDVKSFKEKPDLATAQNYIQQGGYYWNSGMFCFKVGVFLQELQRYAPDIYQACRKAVSAHDRSNPEIRINKDAMHAIPELSIDYAVLEKSNLVKVVPCDIGWSDLGSFDSLYDEVKTESAANATLSQGEVQIEPICVNAKDNLIVSHDRQIALVDVNDLLIIDSADALLIAKRGSSQDVKHIVAEIKKQLPSLAEVHRLVQRPWGTYEVLQNAERYKVKRIVVKPNSKLSLQKHYHRNEHWIVVSGTARVTVDDQQFLVRPNESTYIKMGQVHRLENHGKIDLVMIEVQVGEYTGEDDIERIEDIYGR